VVLDRGSIAGQFSKEQISLDDLMAKLYLVAQTGKLNSQEGQ
jgi:hypothetical protein